MSRLTEVTGYIEENVLYSSPFDDATEQQKIKAVNQAESMLIRVLPQVYPVGNVSVEDVAEQALWLLKMDDSMRRAEMGASSISVDGISISFKDLDRTIAPLILLQNGIKSVKKNRVGAYYQSPHDTFRMRGGGF